MKKLLFLGGAMQQIPVIKKAKQLGIYVITCDYLPSNPGHKYADKYFNVSTTDKEAVLQLAKAEKVDGVVCYASDPAAPIAAYVTEQLGLPGNPYESVEILSNKGLFRSFLEKNQFAVPKAMTFNCYEDALLHIGEFDMPVMVKPVDSSGSKGVCRIDDAEELRLAVEDALSYSRSKTIIIEEYVEKDGYQVAGDGFSVDGKLVFWCFGNDHFEENNINPYVPVAASFPYCKKPEMEEKIHQEIQRVFDLLKMKTGAYNFDIRVGKNKKVYLMEIGPRNGGNYIPQVIEYATGIDMVEYTIKAALGEDCSKLQYKKAEGYWSYYAVHSHRDGKLKAVNISDEMEKCVVDKYMNYSLGETVMKNAGSNSTIGILIMNFKTMDSMLYTMEHGEEWIQVEVE